MGEEPKQLSVVEVRKTIASSLGAAFGFVIGLLWSNVVMSGIVTAGINLQASGDWGGWGILVGTAAVLTVVMVVLILTVSRWGSKA